MEESWQTIFHLRGYSYPELYCKKLSNQKPMANTAGTTRRTTLCWTQAEIKELLLIKLGTECKISQYTDDTTFILDGSQSSFSISLYLLDSFGLISGLKVNYAKTEDLWIGSCKSSEITLPSLKPILWAKDKVCALRVWFSTLEDTCTGVHVSSKWKWTNYLSGLYDF